MIGDSCEVPREDLDDGFNPCRKQVVENGELCAYAHMYDVMNERYDREEDTSYLNAVKRDKIDPNANPPALGDSGRVYIQTPDGVETWMFANNHMTSETASAGGLPTTQAVAEYVAANIPDISALEAEIDGKLDNRYNTLIPSYHLTNGSDLNNIQDGVYFTSNLTESNNLLNKPNYTFLSSVRVDQFANGSLTETRAQIISENKSGTTFYRYRNIDIWSDWTLLYPTPASTVPNPLPVDQGGTGAQTAQGALANLLPHTTSDASATGALVYNVDNNSTYLRVISGESNGNQIDIVNRAGIQAMIDAAVANLATKSDLENYVQKSTETSAHGQVYAVTKDGEQTMEDIVVHLVGN